MRIEKQKGWLKASQDFIRDNGRCILSGPFRGMEYPASTAEERNLIPKLVGSYEDELYKWIDVLLANTFGTVINVGAADGFYAAGFARALPEAHVFAFDTDWRSRARTVAIARENGLANVEVRGMCTPEWLERHMPHEGTLLLVDCEGYEEVLLDPDKVPQLAHSVILVEMHTHVVPRLPQLIKSRFRESHNCWVASSRDKTLAGYPSAEQLDDEGVISEGRGRIMQWWLLIPQGQSVPGLGVPEVEW